MLDFLQKDKGMSNLWQAAISVAGFGSIAAFVFYSLYKEWLTLPIFSSLTSDQTFLLMRLFLIFVFVSFVFAAFIWYLDNNKISQKVNSSESISFCLPDVCTFSQAIHSIARSDDSVAELIGFTSDELNIQLQPQNLTTSSPEKAMILVRNLVKNKPFKEYEVTRNDGIYRVYAKNS